MQLQGVDGPLSGVLGNVGLATKIADLEQRVADLTSQNIMLAGDMRRLMGDFEEVVSERLSGGSPHKPRAEESPGRLEALEKSFTKQVSKI